MYSEKVVVLNKSGLHARPAMLFAKCAMGFKSEITFSKTATPEVEKKAKALMQVMSAGVKFEEEIEIKAVGEDEKEAVTALVDLIKSGCGE